MPVSQLHAVANDTLDEAEEEKPKRVRLTATQVKEAKPLKKEYDLRDTEGLYLTVSPAGYGNTPTFTCVSTTMLFRTLFEDAKISSERLRHFQGIGDQTSDAYDSILKGVRYAVRSEDFGGAYITTARPLGNAHDESLHEVLILSPRPQSYFPK